MRQAGNLMRPCAAPEFFPCCKAYGGVEADGVRKEIFIHFIYPFEQPITPVFVKQIGPSGGLP